jgi:hypothetical protein
LTGHSPIINTCFTFQPGNIQFSKCRDAGQAQAEHDNLFDNICNEAEFQAIVNKALGEKTGLREKLGKMEENGDL